MDTSNANNELAWVFEMLKRAMIARRCGLKEEAISLCNIAENRYKVLLKHPSMEIKMKATYSNALQTINNVRTMINDDSCWNPTPVNESTFKLIESEFNLFISDNDTNIETEL
ncbi:MAG TPA: hypothetical protein V6D19_05470 [Stenomitos sp.]